MMLYGARGERVVACDPFINMFVNTIFIIISLFLIKNGYTHNIYPLLLFIFSVIMSYLNDTLTKILVVIPIEAYKIINTLYYLSIFSYLAWYIGSYAVVINIIVDYTGMVTFYCCLATFLYGTMLVMYFSSLFCLRENNYYPPNTFQTPLDNICY